MQSATNSIWQNRSPFLCVVLDLFLGERSSFTVFLIAIPEKVRCRASSAE